MISVIILHLVYQYQIQAVKKFKKGNGQKQKQT